MLRLSPSLQRYDTIFYVECFPFLHSAGNRIIHADETPWWQGVLGRWLWVVLSATTAVFHIGSRRHEEIRDLLRDGILAWLATDEPAPCSPNARRQRCLAHLIRKRIALAGGLHPD